MRALIKSVAKFIPLVYICNNTQSSVVLFKVRGSLLTVITGNFLMHKTQDFMVINVSITVKCIVMGDTPISQQNQCVETRPLLKRIYYYYMRWDEGIIVRGINQSLHL